MPMNCNLKSSRVCEVYKNWKIEGVRQVSRNFHQVDLIACYVYVYIAYFYIKYKMEKQHNK